MRSEQAGARFLQCTGSNFCGATGKLSSVNMLNGPESLDSARAHVGENKQLETSTALAIVTQHSADQAECLDLHECTLWGNTIENSTLQRCNAACFLCFTVTAMFLACTCSQHKRPRRPANPTSIKRQLTLTLLDPVGSTVKPANQAH